MVRVHILLDFLLESVFAYSFILLFINPSLNTCHCQHNHRNIAKQAAVPCRVLTEAILLETSRVQTMTICETEHVIWQLDTTLILLES